MTHLMVRKVLSLQISLLNALFIILLLTLELNCECPYRFFFLLKGDLRIWSIASREEQANVLPCIGTTRVPRSQYNGLLKLWIFLLFKKQNNIVYFFFLNQ